MRAAIYRESGAARDVLRVEDVATPSPGPGEVLVRVHASGVNPTDYKTRSGATRRPIDEFQVPHQDGAGVIEAVGAGVDGGRVGERVWVWLAAAGRRWGTAAECTVVPSRQAVPLPGVASFELGASLGVPAMTAHRCLFSDGPIAGRTVLVAGGAGAVGHYAIELAKWAGARVVTTVSSARKAELAAMAGADLVVNYRDADALEQIRAYTPHVDRVVEVALGANLPLDLALATPETVVVTYAAEPSNPVLPVRDCMTANVMLRFILLYTVPAAALDAAAADVTAAAAAGALTELPVHRFPLGDIIAAQEAAEGGAVGKVIVEPLSAARRWVASGALAEEQAHAEPVLASRAQALGTGVLAAGVHQVIVAGATHAAFAPSGGMDSQRHVVPERGDDGNEHDVRHGCPRQGVTERPGTA